MKITANGETIQTGIPRADAVYKNGVRCAALRIPLPQGISAQQLSALVSGSITIQTDEGDPIPDGTHEGYNTLVSTEAVIARVLTADQRAAEAQAAAEAAKAQLESSQAAMQLELDETLAAARAGLISVPVAGDIWDADKRYIKGDTATVGGVEYIALKYSRGKAPADSPEHWRLVPAQPSYQAWEEIADGEVIQVGAIVTYEGKTWICKDQHIKSAVYKPKAVSAKWDEYAPEA